MLTILNVFSENPDKFSENFHLHFEYQAAAGINEFKFRLLVWKI